MKLNKFLAYFKNDKNLNIDVRANTDEMTIGCVWYGTLGNFLKKRPTNNSEHSRAEDNCLENYTVTEAEIDDGEENLLTVYIKGRSGYEFYGAEHTPLMQMEEGK